MRLLQVIRWKNLVLIILIQLLIKYYLMPLFKVPALLSNTHFLLLLLASIFIAVAGYIINDLYDVEADSINKPNKLWVYDAASKKRAIIIYIFLNLIGIVFGAFISVIQGKNAHFMLFIIPVVLLYLYALKLKKMLFVGNLTVSLLVAFSMLIIVFFETNIPTFVSDKSFNLGYVICMLALFGFGVNLLREIVKDAEDVIGDKAIGVVSIPIKYGKRVTHAVLKGIVTVLISVILVIALKIYNEEILLVGYLTFGIVPAFILFVFQLDKVKKTDDYSKLSRFLKIIMLVGILAVFVIKPIQSL